MRIGILTFHRGANYGGFLQAWSLRNACRELGADAVVINYKNATHLADEAGAKFRWRQWKKLPTNLRRYRVDAARYGSFKKAIPELSKGEPQTDYRKIDWSQYDAVIVGSDVVWDYQSSHYGSDDVYFGAFPGAEATRWIGYAPSCGKADKGDSLDSAKAEGLKRFSHIGARDQGTRAMVNKVTGRECPLVVDPTWLPAADGSAASKETNSILAIYGYMPIPQPLIRQVKEYARDKGLEIVSYGYFHPWVDRHEAGLNPHQWVQALEAAHTVVTGTFHGTLYSLRLGKRFVTVGNDWISNKISAPLELLDIRERLIGPDGDLIGSLESQNGFDGKSLFKRADSERQSSLDFLKVALGL
ncbi:polysaccharide pyruvyl transferase family protein [Roseibacillus persicicus]|uniref:polysaccharide pyruvyl transferase family protein n=1 Tax=Roseibacillus persicicus TaxID=454148 RepID=UPI00398B4C5B